MRLESNSLKTHIKAHWALFFTNFFFAVNYNIFKYFTQNEIAGPYGINLVRAGGTMLLFWLLFLFRKGNQRIEKVDLLKLALCAFAAIAVNQMLFLKGLSYTSPLHASLLTLVSPVLIVLFASFILREKIGAVKISGLVFAFAGAVLLLSGKEVHKGDNYMLGDLLVIASSISYAFYFILVKPLMEKYSAIMVTRWIFTFGFLMILPFSLSEVAAINVGALTSTDWFFTFFMVFAGTFLAYLFNVYGLKELSASMAGTYIYLQPLLTGVIATLFLHEKITLYKALAAILIFFGLYLVQRTQQKITGSFHG